MVDRVASNYMSRVNYFVPNLTYHSDVAVNGQVKADLGTPVAANATGILSAQSIASAGSVTTFANTYSTDAMAQYGRNVTVVASGAATSTVTIEGRDYLGQPMQEQLTLNGTTAVAGNKAFKAIEKVTYGATAATTINVGWGTKLGLPFKMINVDTELVNKAKPGTAGTYTAAVDTQTLTSGDSRGTYVPNSAPNGTNAYVLVYDADKTALHGSKQFYA